MKEIIKIDGVEISLSHADDIDGQWIGQERYISQLLAAWMIIDNSDLPMNPRLIGKPGVGKTTLAVAAAKILKKDVYIFQATVDTRPEDLLIVPVIASGNKIGYHASSLVTAMVKGGVCILDEGNRMSEKSWASLAPLLDHRRYIESIIAGVKVKAHKDFRIVTTMNDDSSTFEIPDYINSRLQPQILIDFPMNDDSSTFEIPDYINSRLQPQILIDFPDKDEEFLILKTFLPFADEEILHYITIFLQKAHFNDEKYSVRDGINIGRYLSKRIAQKNDIQHKKDYLKEAVKMILGDEALPYL